MWKLRTSSSEAVKYVQPSQRLPVAALIDYVVNTDHSKSRAQLMRTKASFLVADSYSYYTPDDSEESEIASADDHNYFGAPADDCVDLKAANYILQRRLSLQDDD